MRNDERSYDSEVYALACLGMSFDTCVRREVELMRECVTNLMCMPVPEGIWTIDDKSYSVEVKRIVANRLPEGTPRRIRRRGKIIWPWTSTVESAIRKCTSMIAQRYAVDTHCVVFVVPETLSVKHKRKMSKHITEAAQDLQCPLGVKLKLFMVFGPDSLFDRF